MENITVQPTITYSAPTVANGSYLACKKWSFAFVDACKRLIKRNNRIEELTEEAGGKQPSGYMKVTSIMALLIAIGLAFVEAANLQTVLSGTLGLSENMALFVGVVLSSSGILFGERLTNVKKDEFTGRRSYTPAFWGAVLLIVVYIGGTYALASGAASAASDDMKDVVSKTAYYVVFISIAQILVGALFLKTAIKTISLMVLSVRVRLCQLRMKTTSRHTERWWCKHLFDVSKYNTEHGTAISPGELTQSICEARAYYNAGSNDGFLMSHR